MITLFKCLKGSYKEDSNNLFSVAIGGRSRSNGLKLQQGKFRLDIRKEFLSLRKIVEFLSLGRLDYHLSTHEVDMGDLALSKELLSPEISIFQPYFSRML